MRRLTRVSATALGIVLSGVLVNATPAYADWPVIDVGTIAAVNAVKSVLDTVSSTINDVKTYASNILNSLGDNTFGTVQQLLQEGFTQEANYAKAQIGAQEQIADASNTAMAHFDRDMRNAQIRDEQTASPTACAALDGGVSTQAAAVQAFGVSAAIARIQDLRGEAGQGMPSHYGQAQAVASMSQEHANFYCNGDDAAAGLCTVSQHPDADQQAQSLFGSGTYADQAAVNSAKDYEVNLIEPVAPAALRGDQLRSTEGQDAVVRRRSFNARMSLADTVIANTIGIQSPSVPLTAVQQKYLQDMGLPAQTTGSWLQMLQIEAERRISDVNWNANLQSMPPAAVEREIALEGALSTYLLYQIFKMSLQHAAISATQLAEQTEHDFMPTVRMPTPSMAGN